MQRVHFTPRNNWQSRCEEVGFTFHSIDGRYWDESVAYQFSLEQIETLEAATEDLHQRYLETVDWVIRGGHFEPFALPSQAIELIRDSWQRREPCLYGRFDFSWNGQGQPKLLEYNADTPTGLLEASVVQWHWLNDQRPEADQFNALHEKLIARWRQIGQGTVHFAAIDGHEEDTGNALYMLDVANQAGLDVRYLPIESIGHDPFSGRFVDLDDQPIRHCFKLYPWEWLFQDEFGQHIASSGVRFQEPAWKLLMASKAMLPLLWQRYPDHPNLLPASFKDDVPGAYVRKPLYSREGENILIVDGDRRLESPGPSQGPFIYQGFAPLAEVDGNHAVLGSWVIGDQAAGLGIREDASPITRDSSRFVPHYFID